MSANHFALDHEIFILDAYLKKPLDQSQMEPWTRKFVDNVLATLRMEELGPLQIFPAVDLRAPGWSFLQPITTSHMSGHYFEKPGKHPHMRMDFYSCAAINYRKLINVCDEFMELGQWRATFINRHIDDGDRNTMHISGEGNQVLDEMDLLDHDRHLVIAKKAEEAKQELVKNA